MEKTVLHIHLTPKASRNRVGVFETGPDGQRFLRVYVTTVPEEGKANAALIALLSKSWKLPKGAFTILRGKTSRYKVVQVEGTIPEKEG